MYVAINSIDFHFKFCSYVVQSLNWHSYEFGKFLLFYFITWYIRDTGIVMTNHINGIAMGMPGWVCAILSRLTL